MNRESSLFQEISEEVIMDIIKEHFNTECLISYQLMEGGMFNTTYQLMIGEAQQKVILRLGPVNQHLLMEFEKHLMEGETEVYERCSELQIPFPVVLVLDTSRKLFDRDYMITEYIDSVVMVNAKVSNEEKGEIYAETGRYIRKMHSITSDMFGYVYDCMKGNGFSSWYLFLWNLVADIIERSKQFDAFSEDEIQNIYDVFLQHQDILEEVKIPHLLHCDLWEGNILLTEESDKFRLAAIIDGDRAIYGDIDFEIASGWMMNDHFLSGYGVDKMDFESEKRVKRRKVYSIVYLLIEAYVGIAEYHREEMYWNGRNTIREVIETIKRGIE